MEASDIKELRVILDNINVLNDEWFDTFPTDEGQTGIHDSLEYEIVKANKILAKRPRQCDVGTPEEQAERFRNFCKMDYISEDCPDDCPLYRKDCSTIRCPFAWAQTPYEAQEGGAS